MTAARIGLLLLGSTLGLACRSGSTMPEPGAALVRITTTPGTPAPDELRAWVYDDGGRLWDGVRIPESGALTTANAADLGTVLIQPGETVHGDLRVHVRAFAAGLRVLDGVLAMDPAGRDQKTFVLALDPAVPGDVDGDDVPDVIDDCPGVANPLQGGCASVPTMDADVDASVDAGADAVIDAEPEASVDASVDMSLDMSVDTPAIPDASMPDVSPPDVGLPEVSPPDVGSTDVKPPDAGLPDVSPPDVGGTKATGVACSAHGECATAFCVDGVCCATACQERCHSCNQTGKLGTCQNFAQGQDPARECGAGMTCNGAGGCMTTLPATKPQGAACGTGAECSSGFCADKVCCNTACNGTCQNCATGTCNSVQRMDDVPECSGTKTCNNKGACVAG